MRAESPESMHCLLQPIYPLHYSMRFPIMGVCLMKHLNYLKSTANVESIYGVMGWPEMTIKHE